MLRKIFFTFSSRLFVTFINLLVILISARYLGAEGRGIISLLILGITINLLASNVFGGAAIAFLAPRMEIFRLVAPAYIWAVCSNLLVTAVLIVIELLPPSLGFHLLVLSVIQSLYNVHLNILIGKSRLRAHNAINAIQVLVLISGMLWFIFIHADRTAAAYIYALYISLGFSFLLSLFILRDEVKLFPVKEWMGLWRTILKNGLVIQIASLAQLLNYRLGYYMLDHHFATTASEGKKLVGIYSIAIAVAEAAWLISRSMGLIQYTRIVSGEDSSENRALTQRLARMGFLVTLIIMLPLLLLPPSFYSEIFGPEFTEVRNILFLLAPGTLAFAMALMFSNYFAGLGLNAVNLYGSLAGLAVTVCAGIIIMPRYGMEGAAITASVSYLVTSVYLWRAYAGRTKTGVRELMPEKKDFAFIKKEVQKYFEGARLKP